MVGQISFLVFCIILGRVIYNIKYGIDKWVSVGLEILVVIYFIYILLCLYILDFLFIYFLILDFLF